MDNVKFTEVLKTKTGQTAVLTIIGAIIGAVYGTIDWATAIQTILTALMIIFTRHAIAKKK